MQSDSIHTRLCHRRRSSTSHTRFQRRGLSLLEVTVSTLLVGLITVGAMRSLGTSVRASNSTAQTTQAVLMAEELMVEILAQDYSDPDDTAVFGVESTENRSLRADWDDVDDYHKWSASPPVDTDGTAFASKSWTRTVTVAHVDPDDLLTPLAIDDDRGIKRVTVQVLRDNVVVAELHGLQTEAWISTIPEPGNNQTTGQAPPVNLPPTAAITVNHSVGTGFLTAKFDASGSADPEEQPLEYEWDYGDGQHSDGLTATHTFVNDQNSTQSFTVVLTVRDVHGAEGSSRVTVTVFPAPVDGMIDLK